MENYSTLRVGNFAFFLDKEQNINLAKILQITELGYNLLLLGSKREIQAPYVSIYPVELLGFTNFSLGFYLKAPDFIITERNDEIELINISATENIDFYSDYQFLFPKYIREQITENGHSSQVQVQEISLLASDDEDLSLMRITHLGYHVKSIRSNQFLYEGLQFDVLNNRYNGILHVHELQNLYSDKLPGKSMDMEGFIEMTLSKEAKQLRSKNSKNHVKH
jgi:hypothetical protein